MISLPPQNNLYNFITAVSHHGQKRKAVMSSETGNYLRHFPLSRQLLLQHQTKTICAATYINTSDSKRRRTMSIDSSTPAMPQKPNTLVHPANEINRTSQNIVNGEYNTAIASLKKTLKNLKLVLSGDAKFAKPNEYPLPTTSNPGAFEYDFYYSSPNDSYFKAFEIIQEGLRCVSKVARTSPRDSQHDPVQKRTVSIFTSPLIIKESSLDTPLNALLCEELSSVVIYNLALTHQLKAISMLSPLTYQHHNPSVAQAYLHKALSFYEYSHKIFKNQSFQARVPTLQRMTLVSNLGQIHYLLGDSIKARRCNEHIFGVLTHYIEEKKKKNGVPNLCTKTSTLRGYKL